ncbi:MAG: nickel-responsive transcriptional regulator NikR [Candidatus Omnitrophica bacterium]|nr:nickel-responsive transcriptional regulator NikR [Candidatus Omnitrophota bacterium]
MAKLVRFSIALEDKLLAKFDRYAKSKKYQNRSDAIRALIRGELVKSEWRSGREVAGAIVLVYDHHRRELVNKLTDMQHDFHGMVISNQHVHLDHHNCLETIVVKGNPKKIEELADKLKSIKGVKYGALTAATTAKELP